MADLGAAYGKSPFFSPHSHKPSVPVSPSDFSRRAMRLGGCHKSMRSSRMRFGFYVREPSLRFPPFAKEWCHEVSSIRQIEGFRIPGATVRKWGPGVLVPLVRCDRDSRPHILVGGRCGQVWAVMKGVN